MNATLELMVKQVKASKAEKAFDENVACYGSVASCLRSLDCKNRDEAVQMLTTVQKVKIYKLNGKVVVE
jgi:hypothetical protein